MVRTMQPFGYEQGLFDCDERHSAFYSLLGFDTDAAAESFKLQGLQFRSCVKRYDFAKVLARNPGLMEPMGVTQEQKAA